jgi:thioredoxin reductase (NADPH)
MLEELINLLIIGSGPAGFTAGIYASRAGLAPVLYEGSEPGGQLVNTTIVENYPGFPDGIMGPDMMDSFRKHAQNVGTQIRNGQVTAVDFSNYPYKIVIGEQNHISANAVIISTGATAKWLGIESEKRLTGRGVSACAICDGPFFKGQDVIVVGGGDTACEEALYLSNICNKVYVVVRSGKMRASALMQSRLNSKLNIQIIFNTVVKEIVGEAEVEGIILASTLNSDKHINLSAKGVFIAIGHKPNTQIFAPYLELNDYGYIKTIPGSTKTNIEGVFAAGDVQDPVYRQAVTAAASGCMAALDAEKFLVELA